MTKSKILSSALVMGMVSFGAYAADEMITGGAGTCTADVLGVSADGATANTIAVWSINEYTLAPGEYLNVTETSVEPAACPPGSYCVGGTNFTVENASTSIATCPTEYPNSRAGAGAQTQCYTACTVATANIAHATAVGGNDYFGDGADACFATDCDTGYHIDGDIELVEQTPVVPINNETIAPYWDYIRQDSTSFQHDLLSQRNTWVVNFDVGIGVVFGKASCQPRANDAAIDYVYSNYMSVLGGAMTIDAYRAGLEPLVGPILTDYAVGVLSGLKDGSKTEKDMYEAMFVVLGTKKDANYQTTDTGEYCYCQIDSFAPDTGNGVLGEKSTVTSAPWVFNGDIGSADRCAQYCAYYCASYCAGDDMHDAVTSRAFRAAVSGSLGTQMSGICTANTINIDWNPDNGGEHTKNMCTYDGEVTLPTPDPVKPGYTFTGWKLVE